MELVILGECQKAGLQARPRPSTRRASHPRARNWSAAQEVGPERLGFRRADHQTQYFAPAVAVDADDDDHVRRYDPSALARLQPLKRGSAAYCVRPGPFRFTPAQFFQNESTSELLERLRNISLLQLLQELACRRLGLFIPAGRTNESRVYCGIDSVIVIFFNSKLALQILLQGSGWPNKPRWRLTSPPRLPLRRFFHWRHYVRDRWRTDHVVGPFSIRTFLASGFQTLN